MSLRQVCRGTVGRLAVLALVTLLLLPGYQPRRVRANEIHCDPNRQAGATIAPPETSSKRLVNVEDAIEMTRIAGRNAINSYGGSLSSNFASFSPDGRWFVIVLKKGNLEQDTNDYSMLLYASSEVFTRPHPRTLVSFSSSSNRPAIDEVTWLEDSDTILFLGERVGEITQLYSVGRESGSIRKLTNHPTNILRYSTSAHAETLAYLAEKPTVETAGEDVLEHGLHVSEQRLSDLIEGHLQDLQPDLFITDETRDHAETLQVPGLAEDSPLYLSPDGRYLLLKTTVQAAPALWLAYKDGLLQNLMRQRLPRGVRSQIRQYTLVDLRAGVRRVLLDSPIGYHGSEVKWLPDSQSVIVTGVYLPLNVDDSVERTLREEGLSVVEVRVPGLAVSRITNGNMELGDWNPRIRVLKLQLTAQSGVTGRIEEFQQKPYGWDRLAGGSQGAISSKPVITAEQDPNTPPRIIAVDPKTAKKTTLLDPNPLFAHIAFGKVEIVKWIGGANRQVEGGLYLPVNYVPGKRYPLVIQTHGFDPHAFWIDGPFSTAFVAQPLAANGIMVLQVPDSHDWGMRDTPLEAPTMMRTYERAIRYLDARGLIDPNRVGLIGFSQTCLYIQYMLTHSSYHIAAAVAADGIDGGYFQYIAFANSSPYMKSIRQGLAGASPFGHGLNVWRKRSPGFLLYRVNAPILLQAIQPSSLLEEWEWFAGLSALGKPVDLLYIPRGYHVLQKPKDRMLSQRGDLDWFCFWLKVTESK